MKIKNTKNKTNYLNFRDAGVPKRIMIPAGKTVEIIGLNNISQVINEGDFLRGFFEVVTEEIKKVSVEPTKPSKKKKASKKEDKTLEEESEDTFDKVSKEVKEYTEN
jgi:hypothetical protein